LNGDLDFTLGKVKIMIGKHLYLALIAGSLLIILNSCEKFWDPDQALVIPTDNLFLDWSEYRAAELGLYALQQMVVEQIVILGELRADLLEITPNADKDLTEVYNFQVTRENRFATPIYFYKLIGACNSFINQIESAHPEVRSNASVTDYDRIYGEAKCMRAWAYFTAVRIYGKVPYIWQSLTTVKEISEYVNSTRDYIDSVNIRFHQGGYYNDTTYNQPVTLQKQFLDLDQVIDTFTLELERDIKAVGVIHNKDNNDATWDVTVWTWNSYKTLMGQMYLYQGDYTKAMQNFNTIIYNTSSESSFIKYGLDRKFSFGNWKNIFSGIDGDEHIYTLWFNKSYEQRHRLQYYFSKTDPNQYMIKPTHLAISNWESIFEGMRYNIVNASKPELTKLHTYGTPGDRYRGHGISYVYMKDQKIMESQAVWDMLELKKQQLFKDVENIMTGVDTVVYKYTYGKQPYDQDANFILYRAASIHLYAAEIYARWERNYDGVIKPEVSISLSIVNNGSYANNSQQLGVRGRIGFGGEVKGAFREDDGINVSNTLYLHDPNTNEIIGFRTFNNLLEKQEYLEDQIIEERARELAFEGERFFELVRIAKRRGDPSYLANKVARKFSGAKREEIRTLLMDETNWYIPFYE
jgi:hypothetical protein